MTRETETPEMEKLDPELQLKLAAIEAQAKAEPSFPDWRSGGRMLLVAALPVWFVLLPLLWVCKVPLGTRVIFLAVLHLLAGVIAAVKPKR